MFLSHVSLSCFQIHPPDPQINVLQKEISSLNKSTDPPSIAFIEALLQFHLLQVITTSSPGNIIRGLGMVSTFLPLLDDTEPTHMNLVCLAVKTLQKLMDYSNSAVTLLQDLGGVNLFTNRLHIEVVRMIDSMRIGESSDTIDDHIHSQHRLIRVLLKALSSATYASASTTRSQNPHDISLPATLSMIFKNTDTFGGDIYSSVVQVNRRRRRVMTLERESVETLEIEREKREREV
ncbi:hypothetical protein HanPI659440_Chr03g0107011 [Helianthus annuus]|nr:hypothetical protein HanPI659440_Chr03g0107011 [Helianthus annuus]